MVSMVDDAVVWGFRPCRPLVEGRRHR